MSFPSTLVMIPTIATMWIKASLIRLQLQSMGKIPYKHQREIQGRIDSVDELFGTYMVRNFKSHLYNRNIS